MNETNKTNIQEFTNYADTIARFLVFTSNLAYFTLILIFKEKRKFTYYQIHHVNFIGLIASIHVVCWSFHVYPNFKDNTLNKIACYVSEVLWGTLKFTRAYAILALAIYRYIAVFKPKEYKKISRSCKYAAWSTLLVWTIPFLIFFSVKYSVGTTYGYNCFDGYSTNLNIVYIYFAITHFLGIILPCFLVIVIYFSIHNKINKKSNKPKKTISSNKKRSQSTQNDSYSSSTSTKIYSIRVTKKQKKENSLAIQLFILNSLEIISFINIFFLTVPFDVLIEGFDQKTLRLILGPFTGFLFTLIPIITIYFLFKIK